VHTKSTKQANFIQLSTKKPPQSTAYLKSVVFKVWHDDNNVVIVTNTGLHCDDIGLTAAQCKYNNKTSKNKFTAHQ